MDAHSDRTSGALRSDLFRLNVASLVAVVVAVASALCWFRFLTPPEAEESLPGVTVPVICFLLVYWPVYVALYLTWSWRVYSSLDAAGLQSTAVSDLRRNRGWLGSLSGVRRGGTDLTTTAATAAVLVTIVIALTPGIRENTAVIILILVTVVASWAMMVHGFALDYMRATLSQAPDETPHLEFRSTREPTFSDFVTVAVMVSTMGVGSPAEVTTTAMWRRMRMNTVLAFFFNTVIVAMMVSLVFGGITGS
ncbi:DUF1345 domain-containing protein [Corynebacterium variabile]|uniref:DUF1345 domain-containing protein n=1 Tax=Corynebacterium variabile TaxID=1727 RepID=UPI001D4A4D41|nr:DUF1345 domain-containing protein [Corynebacterium variabile]HJG46389.1 DUF1345 domain-containing protein [Corynebacterium variabile]